MTKEYVKLRKLPAIVLYHKWIVGHTLFLKKLANSKQTIQKNILNTHF